MTSKPWKKCLRPESRVFAPTGLSLSARASRKNRPISRRKSCPRPASPQRHEQLGEPVQTPACGRGLPGIGDSRKGLWRLFASLPWPTGIDSMSTAKYKRILLKLSGEVLMGDDSYGINRGTIARIVGEIAQVAALGIEIGVVIGGGNIFRGVAPGAAGLDRATADYMG